MNGSNFVVSIPKELKNIKAKLFMGLTKRQIIGFGITLAISLPVFFFFKKFNLDLALLMLFLTALPVLFCTIFTKDGMAAETWIKLFIEYKFLNPQKRRYRVTKRNHILAKERNMINVKKRIKKDESIPNNATANRQESA